MIGAIVGDIAGSRFEWHNRKSKRFTFLKGEDESRHPCRFTDDSVMTIGVADGLLRAGRHADEKTIKASLISSMQYWGQKYPYAGYSFSPIR